MRPGTPPLSYQRKRCLLIRGRAFADLYHRWALSWKPGALCLLRVLGVLQTWSMQEITYASKSFVTTDRIAEALLDLVTAIDRQAHSEAVTVPAFTDTGRQVEAKMTLDAGSELVSVPVDLDLDDSFDASVVETAVDDIRRRIRNVNSAARPVYATPEDIAHSLNLDDL
jgi:hypothetical protein